MTAAERLSHRQRKLRAWTYYPARIQAGHGYLDLDRARGARDRSRRAEFVRRARINWRVARSMEPATRPGTCVSPDCTERALHYSLWCAVHEVVEPTPLFAGGGA